MGNKVVGLKVLICALLVLGGVSSASANAFGWFWAVIPPRMADGERSRAVDMIATAQYDNRRVFGSEAMARRVLGTWSHEITTAAHASRLSEALLAALVMVESSGNDKAISPAGAQGLGQLMPGTARHLGVRDAFHPTQNLRGAAAYLSDLLDMFGGDLVLALAAYNAGEGAVMRHKGVPPYKETRAYVPKVLSAFLYAQTFCANGLSSSPSGGPSGDPRAECPLPERLAGTE